ITSVGRSPHEAFFSPDGKEVWVSIRGENYIAVLDGQSFQEKTRITVPNGPGMTIFSPDGRYGYVCSSFSPETVVISAADHKIVGHVKQESPFCPDIAATPDGAQVWFTLKDVGKTMVFNARPPFDVLKVIDTGPITNHVNIVRNARGQFAYVTVGGRTRSNRSPPCRPARCRTACGRRATARAYMWASRMKVPSRPSTRRRTRSWRRCRSARPRRAWPTCPMPCRRATAWRTCSRSAT